MKLECVFCGGQFTLVQNHVRHCHSNPDRIPRSGENNPNYGKRGKNQYSKAKDLEITYIPSIKVIEGLKKNHQ